MKNLFLLLITIIFFTSCEKTKVEVEENISFELNAASAVINNGNTYDVKLTMKSKVPSWGVRVEATATEEAGGATVGPQAPATTLTLTTTNLSIQNLPRQKWVVVQVNVSSTKTTTNSSTQSFRIIYK